MKSDWFTLLLVLLLGELSHDQDDEFGIVPPLAYFASRANYPMIRMMKSEWLPLLMMKSESNDEIG